MKESGFQRSYEYSRETSEIEVRCAKLKSIQVRHEGLSVKEMEGTERKVG